MLRHILHKAKAWHAIVNEKQAIMGQPSYQTKPGLCMRQTETAAGKGPTFQGTNKHLHLRDAGLQMNGKMRCVQRTSIPDHGTGCKYQGWVSWYQEGAAAEASVLEAPRLAVLASPALAHLSDSALQASGALMPLSEALSNDSLAHLGAITMDFRRGACCWSPGPSGRSILEAPSRRQKC